MTKPAVVLIGADKGGVGKTMVARTLLDYFAHRQVRARAFAEKLKSGVHAAWALAAAQQYASRERLALVTQTALVLRPKDDFWEATLRARELLSKARFVDLPEQGNAIFEASPEAVVESTKEFLRG